jgi:hypothetical protein
MRWLAAWLLVVVMVGATVSGCDGSAPGDPRPTTPGEPPTGEFEAPEPTDQFLRALRTDLCALVDQALAGQLGWQIASQAAQNLVVCGAARPDLQQSVSLELELADGQRDGPASGDKCHRVRIIEQTSGLAAKAVVTAADDPCGLAERFAATAAQRFAAEVGAVEPPDPWIALDACELLRPALADSAAALGGPKPRSTRLRRIGLRGCLASHRSGTVELSLTPAAGRAADLDGDEVAVAGRRAVVQRRASSCALLLVGEQLGGSGRNAETQVVTVTVAADGTDPASQCEIAQAMAGTVVSTLP